MKLRKLFPAWIKVLYKNVKGRMPSEKMAYKNRSAKQLKMQERSSLILKKIYKDNNISILNGPFKGLKYIDLSNGSQLLPKLIGSYEEPIHRWIYDILEKGEYTSIIDVGCAEGYYAVGFAKSKNKPRIFAFDIDKDALKNAKKLAEINGVSNEILFYDLFDPSFISKLTMSESAKKVLIFMDVEGAELDLLNTINAPDILSCDILVELHDCFQPGLSEKMIENFHSTHVIEIIVDYPKRLADYFQSEMNLSEEDKQFIFDERRPKAMRWMYARKI